MDINNLVSKNIWVLDVAEAENLLLIEDVIKAVANHMGKVPDDVFKTVKKNLSDFFAKEMPSQILLFFKKILDNEDYDGILRVFNLKNALIPNSKICEEIGVRNKKEYRRLLITLLKKNDANSKILKDAIKAKIIMTPIV